MLVLKLSALLDRLNVSVVKVHIKDAWIARARQVKLAETK